MHTRPEKVFQRRVFSLLHESDTKFIEDMHGGHTLMQFAKEAGAEHSFGDRTR